MLRLFKRSALIRTPRHPRQCSLRVERLDDRITPSAPIIQSFNFEQLEPNKFRLYGRVSDDAPVLGLVVYFGGQVQAVQTLDATVDANGNYSVEFTRASGDYGLITADCTDWTGEKAEQETVDLT